MLILVGGLTYDGAFASSSHSQHLRLTHVAPHRDIRRSIS